MNLIKSHYKADCHGTENELIYSDEFVMREITRTTDSLSSLHIHLWSTGTA